MFLNGTSFNWNIIEKTGGGASLWLLRENTTSWACFETSGLKDIFLLYAHFDILSNHYLITPQIH